MQDAVAFVRKHADVHSAGISSSSGSSSRKSGSSSSSKSGRSSKSSSSARDLEARLSKRLASLEMDEAKRISRLIRYVVGQTAPTVSTPPPSLSLGAGAAWAAQHLTAAAAKEVSGEHAAVRREVQGERAAAKAAQAAARSAVATYLAHLEGVSDFMSASFKFTPVDDVPLPASVPKSTSSQSPASAAAEPKILGPDWTRGRIERPAGTKDMGGWTASVYAYFKRDVC